jgi:hypothetical protein
MSVAFSPSSLAGALQTEYYIENWRFSRAQLLLRDLVCPIPRRAQIFTRELDRSRQIEIVIRVNAIRRTHGFWA